MINNLIHDLQFDAWLTIWYMIYNLIHDLQFDVGVRVSIGVAGRQLHTAHHTDHQGVPDRGVLQPQEDLPPVMWQ